MRFITRKIHAVIDYPVALSLIGMPFLLGLGKTNPAALWLPVATGGAALVLNILTNHEAGLIKVLPYSFHVLMDRLVGLTFAVAPFALGFTGVDAIYYRANAAIVLAATCVFNVPLGDNAA